MEDLKRNQEIAGPTAAGNRKYRRYRAAARPTPPTGAEDRPRRWRRNQAIRQKSDQNGLARSHGSQQPFRARPDFLLFLSPTPCLSDSLPRPPPFLFTEN